MMKESIVLFAALVLAGCQPHDKQPAPAETARVQQSTPPVPEPSIKAVKLGDTPDSFKQKFSNAMCFNDKATGSITSCLANGISYATLTGMVTVQFQEGKAVVVAVRNLDEGQFSTVSSALVQKMGPSSADAVEMLKEQPGSLAWAGDTWVFTVTPAAFDGKPGVLLMDKAFLVDSLSKQAKKAEQDL